MKQKQLHRDIIENCADAVVIATVAQKIAYMNRAAEALFGRLRQSAVGQSLGLLLPERFRGAHSRLVAEFACTSKTARYMEQRDATIYGLRADGSEFPAMVSILRLGEGSHMALVAIIRDITAQIALEQRLQRLASIDSLTGLLNRRAFMARAEQELSRARRYGHPLSAAMIDIDHFKRINDRFGHAAGDSALCHVCRIIESHTRLSDVVARWGGEEFVILFPETDKTTSLSLAERLCHNIQAEPLIAETHTIEPVRLTVSIGVAQLGAGVEHVDHLVNAADRALYRAKRAGRNRAMGSSEPPGCASSREPDSPGESL